MKCVLIVTKSETVLTFRRGLIERLKESGCSVTVIAYDKECRQETENMGAKFYCVRQENRRLNPAGIAQYTWQTYKILKQEKPDFVFTFQLKPNTFGILAAHAAKVKRKYAMVEGAGDVFIHNTLKWKAIRAVACVLYKAAFQKVNNVFFLNKEDKREFVMRRLVKEEACSVIPGVGVDLERFACKPVKNNRNFLMIARMLKTKGVLDYCQCARLVKKQYPDARFCYLGAEGTVTLKDIQQYIDDGSLEYLGTTKDVRPYLEECSVFVLPSYREGMPMAVMEAQAMGRCVLVTDVVGCRDTVCDGENGFLIQKGEYKAMAEKCIWFLENPEAVVAMGKNARHYAESNFDSQDVNSRIMHELQTH